MASMNPILSAQGIQQRFGELTAVDDVSVDIRENSIHAVIGPNGAGKTTLFNILAGTQSPTAGKVVYAGRDVTSMPIHQRVKIGMSKSFQRTSLFADLTVLENVRLAVQAADGAEPYVFWRSTDPGGRLSGIAEELLGSVGLRALSGARVGEISHAAQRTLEIALALASKPKIIFLDEPLAGMSIDDIHRAKHLIRSLSERMTVVLIEHNMSVVLGISDTITVMARGRKIVEGPPEAIRSHPDVRQVYLGHAP